jgi:hypothetical protein
VRRIAECGFHREKDLGEELEELEELVRDAS